MEAVKMGILGSLGMEEEPKLTTKATEEELRTMYRLYRETLREMRGNSSNTKSKTISTVVFPATVKEIKAPGRSDHLHLGHHMQWYRAIFHKNPNIQAELTLARAQLKISRQVLDKPTSAQPELRPKIKVKVNRKRTENSPVFLNVSGIPDVRLDIRSEVEKWIRTDGGQRLVVDVGMTEGEANLKTTPTISLELDLKQARRTRLPRSNKEDDCDERGWCCRKSVTISFKDIGWADWVVAPTEYTMHFCDGSCPHNYKPASMHTQVKSRLHQIMKGGTSRPCCVPSAYEPMVLLHYDSSGKMKLTPFNDLIVSKCHCA
ncbi:growth/differentiation factor 3 isoform X2 [Notolabrus celidotus]|nr:growth/differentiation factor 3 isoform X2 [Notolabrus celidotus]XP_034558097.1 growth/differentiation factor 3 isoform X2 [Notolabrus celidotus]